MSAGSAGVCTYCRKSCRQLRCSLCHEAVYCSVDCQRSHWKSGHKNECTGRRRGNRNKEAQAMEAWIELQQTLVGISVEEAHQKYQISVDEKNLLEEEIKSRSSETESSKSIDKNENHDQDGTIVPAAAKVASKDSIKTRSNFTPTTTISNEKLESIGPSVIHNYDSDRKWIYAIEEMSSISSYRATIRPNQEFITIEQHTVIPSLDALELIAKPTNKGTTIVGLHNKSPKTDVLLSAQFPTTLVHSTEQPGVVQIENDSICLRIQSKDLVMSHFVSDQTAVKDLEFLCCRSCHQLLLDQHPISRIFPLPSGYWDEITDYIICYDGQPAIDFASSSTEAQSGQAMEDSGVLVLHREDIGLSVCVLAVEGYGEEEEVITNAKGNSTARELDTNEDEPITYRGSRAWRDSVGGATICCSQCCSILGFASIASPDTFRLLKHRLSTNFQFNRDVFSVHTCASFVVHEMVRYAESKAIFTFIIAVRTEAQGDTNNVTKHKSAGGKCLLLKILSWDTKIATSASSAPNQDGIDILKFKNVAKVIYEETQDQFMEAEAADITSWTWGGVDLCCLPDASDETSMLETALARDESPAKPTTPASVRLNLSRDEWIELRQSLKSGSLHFSTAVANATVLLALGRSTALSESVGLSALPRL